MIAKKKKRSVFVCQQCGNEFSKWMGRCPECGEWESLSEMKISGKGRAKSKEQRAKAIEAIALNKIEHSTTVRNSTGIRELDRVLGGGLVGGQAVLIAGEPGIGKSTLLLQVADSLRKQKNKKTKKQRNRNQSSIIDHKSLVLYVCGEESPGQIKLRAERLGIDGENIVLYPETEVEEVVERIGDGVVQNKDKSSVIGYWSLIIADSIQALYSDDLTGIPGSVGQVRLCSHKLIDICKSLSIPLVLIGQVTKEGTIAGPKVLEHAVDTVLYFEGERMEEIRLLRCLKNRFGTVDELAVFKMTEKGLTELSDASRLFSDAEEGPQVGAVLCPVIAGMRVLLVEIQSLVVPTKLANPRRVAQGIPRARLEMIAAVLQKHLRLPLYKFDIFINVSGGLKVDDPGADLAVALAVYSSLKNRSLPKRSAAFGELTLLAGIRSPLQQKKRAEEAKRLNINQVYSSATTKYLQELVNKVFPGKKK